MSPMSSHQKRELPTQLLVINSSFSPEKITLLRNSAFQLELRPHFVQIRDFLDHPGSSFTTYAQLKDEVEKQITTTIKSITHENSLFLLPKSWFNNGNKDLFSDLAEKKVFCTGEVAYFATAEIAAECDFHQKFITPCPEFEHPLNFLFDINQELANFAARNATQENEFSEHDKENQTSRSLGGNLEKIGVWNLEKLGLESKKLWSVRNFGLDSHPEIH